MKIYRSADEKMTPDWIFNQKSKDYFNKETLSNDELQRIASQVNDISEDDLVAERDRIEHCASTKSTYLYNINWTNQVKASLKEYATVCGMDMTKFRAVEPSKVVVEKVASSEVMIKTASAKLVVDAFKIDEKASNSWEKGKWQQEVHNAQKLAEKPAMNGIVPVRGGEDYFANSESKLAINQNSISNPNAIGKLADSQAEDTGTRLKRENKEKEDAKKTRHSEWQKEKVEATANNLIQDRKVFPTASMNAQPGIRGNVFDFTTVPELTDGEKLKTANEERRTKIQGAIKEKHEFKVEKNPTPTVSDTFAEELKKHLK